MFIMKKIKEESNNNNTNYVNNQASTSNNTNNKERNESKFHSLIYSGKSHKQEKQENSEWALQKDLFKDIVTNLNQRKRGQPMDLNVFTPELPNIYSRNNKTNFNSNKINSLNDPSFNLNNSSFYDSIVKKFNINDKKPESKVNALSMSIKILKRANEASRITLNTANIISNDKTTIKSEEIQKFDLNKRKSNLNNKRSSNLNNDASISDNSKSMQRKSIEMKEARKSKDKTIQSPVLSPQLKLRRPSLNNQKVNIYENGNFAINRTNSLNNIKTYDFNNKMDNKKPKFIKKLYLSPQKIRNENSKLNLNNLSPYKNEKHILSLKENQNNKNLGLNILNQEDLKMILKSEENKVNPNEKQKKNWFCCF